MSRHQNRDMFTAFTRKLHNRTLFSPGLLKSGDFFLQKNGKNLEKCMHIP